jgi:trigger factor
MQITIEDISPVEKRVDFEVPWAELSIKLDKAYEKIRREAKIKGFRPGKAPRSVLEKLYRAEVEERVSHEAVEHAIVQAISEKQIAPITPPTVDKLELKLGEPFRFSARVEIRSQVSPKDYSGLTIHRRAPVVKDEEIEQALKNYQHRFTVFNPVTDREVTANDDLLTIEVHGRVGEHKIKTRTIQVDLSDPNGGGLPGLSERLRGIPIQAQGYEVKYQTPADSPAKTLAGKDVNVRISIKEVRSRKVPPLDDELAKDTGEADTLVDLRNKVRERLIEAENQRIKREMTSLLVKEIVKANPFPVAPSLIDRYAEDIVMRTQHQLRLMGVDVDGAGFDPQVMLKEARGDAEEEARASILIQAIAEKEGLEASEGDLQKRLAEIAAARNESVKKLRAELEHNGRIASVRAQIVSDKTVELLLSQAKIAEAEPERLIVTPAEAAAEDAQQNKRK